MGDRDGTIQAGKVSAHGEGFSTLLKIIAGILRPDKGSIG